MQLITPYAAAARLPQISARLSLLWTMGEIVPTI
jgi:hypothetical protein